ncbi:MAG: Pvc16 family protein [Chloroflexota bacterium]
MIHILDTLLRDLLLAQVAQLSDESQVRFQPPDDDWRTYVSTLTVGGIPVNALNIYLFDLRENRRLRSNARTRIVDNGMVSEQAAPNRVDCHYVISAWSPATLTPATEPTLDEHALLYETLAVLMQHAPVNPSRIYPPASPQLAAIPELIRTADLPTDVAPSDGFGKLSEFWGGMDAEARWKPVIYVVVTLPVLLLPEIAGPLVITKQIRLEIIDLPGTQQIWFQIGGTVRDSNTLDPIPGADVSLVELVLESVTDENGRFTLTMIPAGNYTLRTTVGPTTVDQAVIVPTAVANGYDVSFVP